MPPRALSLSRLPSPRRRAPTHPRPLLSSSASPPSNSAVGLAFELAALSFLTSPPLSLSLLRVGAANDRGVDLRGWWEVPRRRRGAGELQGKGKGREQVERTRTGTGTGSGGRMRWGVVVQCKAEGRKIGPGVVRELEGAVGFERRARHDDDDNDDDEGTSPTKRRPDPPTIAILVSSSGFSKEATLRAFASRIPLSLISLVAAPRTEEDPTRSYSATGGVGAVVEYVCDGLSVNPALRELVGDALEVKRLRRTEGTLGEEGTGELARDQIQIRWMSELRE